MRSRKTTVLPLENENLLVYHLSELARPGRRAALTLQRWLPDRDAKPHRHDFTELVFVVDGYGVNRVNSKNFPIRAGDVFLIGADSTHTFHTASKLAIYNLMFRSEDFIAPEVLADLRRTAHGGRFWGENAELLGKVSFSPSGAGEFRALLERLAIELECPPAPASELAVQGLILQILGMALRDDQSGVFTAAAAGEDSISSTQAYNQLARILSFVNLHFREALTLRKVADHVHLSPNYLGNFFKLHTGLPLFRYLNLLRIEEAERLFRERPDWNVTEVASRCGFADPSYFARCYRRYTHNAPSEMRRSKSFSSRTSVNSAGK